MGALADRRTETAARIGKLQNELQPAEARSKGKACVYATGSFGRREASSHSDLDVFIVSKVDDKGNRLLKRLDEICIKADLIEITRKLGIPDFSGDGRYLEHYTVHDLTTTLGTPEDDVTNTFTARLLLLFESCPLLETGVYHETTEEVITAYWGDYEGHKNEFMPAFLANDILRLWRTFCVNYEARTAREPAEAMAKRKLKNYKLKHSRMLTCYSALLYLLAVFREQRTVGLTDAVSMIRTTPTERLEWLLQQTTMTHAHDRTRKLLEQYEHFLQATNAEERELVSRFLDKNTGREYMRAANEFGDLVFELLTSIGEGERFYRLLVV
ncbi:MAG TPA: nucleotidyltransferase domain-containing protein [Bryobacteraceae bacterium]|nr:nucleotidyltransferase domain-containing protein [Bryobacteraceae bacterium]